MKLEINSTIAAKEMEGIPKRKENFAASPLFQPDTKAVEIVIPDLETQNNCQCLRDLSINYLKVYGLLNLKNPFRSISCTKIAMRRETNAIDKLERRTLSKKR